MTRREELIAEGYFLFGFHKPEHRAEHSVNHDPDFAVEYLEEEYMKRFTVYYLAYKKLNHVPVTYTAPLGEL